jgi:hypothetical protein
MAADLTFAPGFAARAREPSPRTVRDLARGPAAPVVSVDVVLPMTAEQRRALAMLIHTPPGDAARFPGARVGGGVAWAVVTACALAWTLTIATALISDAAVAQASSASHVAMPHVAEGGARA